MRFISFVALGGTLLTLCAGVSAAEVQSIEPLPAGIKISAAHRLGIQFAVPNNELDQPNTESRPSIFLATENQLPASTLPTIVITADKVKLGSREALSAKGRMEVAEKKYISPLYRATFGPLAQLATYYYDWPSIFAGWHPNEAEAMTLYREADRIRILSEVDELVRLEMIGGAKDTKRLKRIRTEVRRTGIDSLYWSRTKR